MMDFCKILKTNALNGGKRTKYTFESYWKKSQQFFASLTYKPNIIITIDCLSVPRCHLSTTRGWTSKRSEAGIKNVFSAKCETLEAIRVTADCLFRRTFAA